MKHTQLGLLLLIFLTPCVRPMGSGQPSGVSLLVVPAQPNLVQVARDMSDMGEAMMMSYAPEAPAESPFLHIWDGERWLPVPEASFSSGNFLTNSVDRMVIVGEETDQTAFLIQQALAWCPEVLHMETLRVTDLINQLGKVYGFSSSEWEWIAQRYQLELDNLTKELPRQSWYDTHRPADVPVTQPPWRQKKQTSPVPPPPATSLTPLEDDAPEEFTEELEMP